MYLSLFILASFFYIGSAEEWSFYEETGFYYQVHRSTEGLNSSEASAHCRSLGAELASIQSKKENDLIYAISRHGFFTGKNWDEMTLIGASVYDLEAGKYDNWEKHMGISQHSPDKNCAVMMTSNQDYWTLKNRFDNYFILRAGEWVHVQCATKFRSMVCKASTNPESMNISEPVETTTIADGTAETTSQATAVQNSMVETQDKNTKPVHHLASGLFIQIKDIEIMGLALVIILLLICVICIVVRKKATVIVQVVRNDSTDATLSFEKSSAKAPFVSLSETPKKVKGKIQSENGLQKENFYGRGIDDFESGLYNAQYYPGLGDNSLFKVVIDDFE